LWDSVTERRRRAVLDGQGSRKMKFFGMVVLPKASTVSTGFPRSRRLCGMSRRTENLFVIGYIPKNKNVLRRRSNPKQETVRLRYVLVAV
jgi:hypothetical protein